MKKSLVFRGVDIRGAANIAFWFFRGPRLR